MCFSNFDKGLIVRSLIANDWAVSGVWYAIFVAVFDNLTLLAEWMELDLITHWGDGREFGELFDMVNTTAKS